MAAVTQQEDAVRRQRLVRYKNKDCSAGRNRVRYLNRYSRCRVLKTGIYQQHVRNVSVALKSIGDQLQGEAISCL